MEKLTPMYAIFYHLVNVQGNSECMIEDEVGKDGMPIPFTGSAKKCVNRANKFIGENPNLKVWVRQYGYKERGLRSWEGETIDFTKIFEYNPITKGECNGFVKE